MRAWPLHVFTLAAKDRTAELFARNSNSEPAVMCVAKAHGLAFRDYTTIGDSDIRALVFEVAGCSQPLLVVLLAATFDQEPLAQSARRPGYVLRYVYRPQSGQTPPAGSLRWTPFVRQPEALLKV